ncbi:GTP 3',8-cyclase MoaA [bacterium]|nr:GTP 3',8-cyclase MoaA [bacterium]
MPAPMPLAGPLVDQHGRTFTYLRIAVTEACNLRCVYCMPEEGLPLTPERERLSGDEIRRVIRVGARLGVSKIRFTGGEPTLRPDLPDLVADASRTSGIASVHLTTNGLLLAKLAHPLADAGLSGVNVSVDSLDAARYRQIARRDAFGPAMAGLAAAIDAGIASVKINVVALHGMNDDEIAAFARLTREMPVSVRFIELMPFDSHQIWRTGRFVTSGQIVDALHAAYPDIEDAGGTRTEHRAFRLPGARGTIGVIPAYTRDLCGACDRIRLTADGRIRNCLFARGEFDLRALLRDGSGDAAIETRLREAVWAKARDGWDAQREATPVAFVGRVRESMTEIGG